MLALPISVISTTSAFVPCVPLHLPYPHPTLISTTFTTTLKCRHLCALPAKSRRTSIFNPSCSARPPFAPKPRPSSLPPQQQPASSFYAAALIELLAALLAVVLCKLFQLPILGPNFSITVEALARAVKISLPFSALFWLIDKIPTGIHQATDQRFRQIFATRSIIEVTFFCACVALGEELLFRACLLAALSASGLSSVAALMISSLVFGLFHAYTFVYMLLATIAGLIFGTMFLTTGSTLEPLMVHFLYDFATIIIMKARWRSK